MSNASISCSATPHDATHIQASKADLGICSYVSSSQHGHKRIDRLTNIQQSMDVQQVCEPDAEAALDRLGGIPAVPARTSPHLTDQKGVHSKHAL